MKPDSTIDDLSDLNIEVIRTDRKKTASIRLRDGQVQIVVPRRMSQRRIDDILQEKAGWIRRAVLRDACRPRYQPKVFRPGEIFTYLGRDYALNPIPEKLDWPRLDGDRLLVSTGASADIQTQVRAFYVHAASRYLPDRTADIAPMMQADPASITIKHYKARWGACNTRGEIFYNWRIIIAPAAVVDYVIVHELAHLHHHNHSRDFWSCVEATMPDYKVHKAWLKEHNDMLRID